MVNTEMQGSNPDEFFELNEMTNDSLVRLIRDQLGITVKALVTVAAAIRILEERGVDVGELKLTMLGHLRRIAHGQLLPELVVRFQGHPRLLSMAAALPMPDQMRLKDATSLAIVEMDQQGATAKRMIPPESLRTSQLVQIFGRDGIRGEDEQILYLKAGVAVRQPVRTAPDGVVIDRTRKSIIVNGYRLSLAELLDYAARLSN